MKKNISILLAILAVGILFGLAWYMKNLRAEVNVLSDIDKGFDAYIAARESNVLYDACTQKFSLSGYSFYTD